MITLYHYVHCPFCLRVRMALGFLQTSYQSRVLPYDDESTPISLMGKKMLPIVEFSDGHISNESLDIISRLDQKNSLKAAQLNTNPTLLDHVDQMTKKIGSIVHPLAMPYWIYTPEFNNSSRAYFQAKKEAKRGPFKTLVQNKNSYTKLIPTLSDEILEQIKPFYMSHEFSILDIVIASHLWGLYVVPEVNLPERLHNYLQKVSNIANFNYHEDFWK